MKDLYNAVLIFGPPGVGKGLISKGLGLSDEIYHISTGDIFRNIKPSSEKGKMIKNYLDTGKLLPNDLTVDIFYEYIQQKIEDNEYVPSKQYLLLDGIPRTLKQAILLEKHIKVKYVIVLEMKDIKKLIDRMKKRALIEKRVDDSNEKILENRINIYLNDTSKLLTHYSKDIIFRFSSDQKKLEVLRDVLIKFASLLD